jgi:hypothetical protein
VCLTVKMTPTFLMLLYCSPLENAWEGYLKGVILLYVIITMIFLV